MPEASYRAERYSVKTKHIHIKVSESDHEMIVKRAAELNMTVSEYIRRLVVTDVAVAESNK